MRTFADEADCAITHICDVRTDVREQRSKEMKEKTGHAPKIVKDYRDLLDDKSIDAFMVATPDHWHAMLTIEGCRAGKDVYVEKPASHNILEGRVAVAMARKHGRMVQMGTQARSAAHFKEAQGFARSGALGKLISGKAWETARNREVHLAKDGEPPATIDYHLWQGPAPERAYNSSIVGGAWRWMFDYGTGDLGNDGVHRLDVAFAALNAACEAQGDKPLVLPRKIHSAGGKWYFDDAQEFPDTLQVSYEYHAGDTPKLLTYEMRIWAPYRMENESEGSAVYGDKGYIVIGNSGWRVYTTRNKLIKEVKGDSFEGPHVQNFVDCIKSRQKPNCDLETVGHPASVLCHAGNISARVGRQVILDPVTETFENDDEANALRTRPEYRKPWVLPEV